MGYGVTGKELGWFRDYLTDRRQVVAVQNTLSDPCDVAFCVPKVQSLDHCCLCCSSIIYVLLSANEIYYYTLMMLLFFSAHKDIKILEETLNAELDEVKNGLSVIFFLSTKEKQNL